MFGHLSYTWVVIETMLLLHILISNRALKGIINCLVETVSYIDRNVASFYSRHISVMAVAVTASILPLNAGALANCKKVKGED